MTNDPSSPDAAIETVPVFRDEPYRREIEARLVRVVPAADEGAGPGLIFDRTIFFAEGGGQPGDTGTVRTADGREIAIASTRKGPDGASIVMTCEPGTQPPAAGETCTMALDWERRHRLMRMHTACHLMTVALPYPITGAAVGESESRLDFDLPDGPPEKAAVTAALAKLIAADDPVYTRWITDADLAANPGLVKSANVRPPSNAGHIRLVCIGEDAAIDAQPCGGTHVATTGEIGPVHIGKIEKKGRTNRRFRLRFGAAPV